MEDTEFDFNIAIVGLGLIGGSYAKALKALKPKKVIGIDCNPDAVYTALSMGIIEEGYTEGYKGLSDVDLVILALYPRDTIKFINGNIKYFKKGAKITDTCGLKRIVIEEVLKALPEDLEFIGGHPMAGKETKGLTNATKDLFYDTNYIITPHAKNKEKSLKLVERIAYSMGCKSVIRVDYREHDKIISFTSHLPHIIAISLMNSENIKDVLGKFIGGSFKDATRVADINSKLWLQLFMINSEELFEEIEGFENVLYSLKTAIKEKDKLTIQNFFNIAKQNREKLI